MSHNEAYVDVLHLIADEVVQFLTKHEGSWSMERLYDGCNYLAKESPCLIHRNICAPPYSCQMCRTAWILTQVSKDMKARAQAFGKEEELRYYPNTNARVEREWGYGTLTPIAIIRTENHPAGDGHFSRDWAASYWDDDWAASSWGDHWWSWGDHWWSGTRWRHSHTFT